MKRYRQIVQEQNITWFLNCRILHFKQIEYHSSCAIKSGILRQFDSGVCTVHGHAVLLRSFLSNYYKTNQLLAIFFTNYLINFSRVYM